MATLMRLVDTKIDFLLTTFNTLPVTLDSGLGTSFLRIFHVNTRVATAVDLNKRLERINLSIFLHVTLFTCIYLKFPLFQGRGSYDSSSLCLLFPLLLSFYLFFATFPVFVKNVFPLIFFDFLSQSCASFLSPFISQYL